MNGTLYVGTGARISARGKARFYLGERVHIGEGTLISIEDDPEIKSFASLSVGSDSYIGPMNNIRAAGAPIRIGEKALISQFVTIVSSNHGMRRQEPMLTQPWVGTASGIEIGDDVWIGAGAVILPGVKIGKGVVVAANAVVTKSVDEYQIVAGVPARSIGIRN